MNAIPSAPPTELVARLAAHGQEHVLRDWSRLSATDRQRFADELAAVDLGELARCAAIARGGPSAAPESPAVRALRAADPPDLVRLPRSESDRDALRQAGERGRALLAAGKVGALLVAGGQGTRLGFEHPKGMYPIGPVSGATLFQGFAEQLRSVAAHSGKSIPYAVMTSDATHDETVAFFAAHDRFGLADEDLSFFRQGQMPAVETGTGRMLLSEPGRLALSPDGHGGLFAALARSGVLDAFRRRGVEVLYYHQVDNPAAIVCDAVFLGLHAARGSEMSTKVVAKRGPGERMGVVAGIDGRTEIVEYSDLPEELSRDVRSDGSLRFWAGNTAIHAFDLAFLERIVAATGTGGGLPWHVAHKVVPFVDETGRSVVPEQPNAWKFERFVFDALPLARTALVVETDRAREFQPVKNATGDDSPQSTRAALARTWRSWLESAGAIVAEGATVEIAPTFAQGADEVRARIAPGTRFAQSCRLE